jgi:small basic protein
MLTIVLVASIIGMFAAIAVMNAQQASAGAVRCSYQQPRHSDVFINCTQDDTPFILPFP